MVTGVGSFKGLGRIDRSLADLPSKIESRGSFFIISYFHKAPRLKEATVGRYFIGSRSTLTLLLLSHKRDTPIVYFVAYPATEEQIFQK